MNRVSLKYVVIFLVLLVHAEPLLADITSMPHNPTLSRYQAWFGDFNFIRHMSMPNRNSQSSNVNCVGFMDPPDVTG